MARLRGLALALVLLLTPLLSLAQPALAALAWQLQTVDSAGDVGWFTGLELDSSGNPVISYYDNSNRALKLASSVEQVTYLWSGFFQPVDNLPTVNSVKAGSAVPLIFSLGGDQGLNIFAQGYPKSQPIVCDSGAPLDDIEQTVTAGASGLSYDAATGQYSYTWTTEKSWAGTCRQLIVKLSDGTEHSAIFKFK